MFGAEINFAEHRADFARPAVRINVEQLIDYVGPPTVTLLQPHHPVAVITSRGIGKDKRRMAAVRVGGHLQFPDIILVAVSAEKCEDTLKSDGYGICLEFGNDSLGIVDGRIAQLGV